MKPIYTILVAIIALFASSCTTDATIDSPIDIENGEQTTLTLSLEESRTQLGEKAGDLYPLYWSEGDKIAVNGVASAPLAAESDGSSTAVFNIDGVIDHPYNIVYPAPTEDAKVITEGENGAEVKLYPVTFPAEQSYKVGTIADGVAPMYGYVAEAGAVPSLNHLSGILRFAIKGEVTLSRVVVKSEAGAIAGTYYVRCETGELVAKEESTSSTISMSFGEGLVLNKEEAQPIHIVVPQGNHGVFVATFHATTGEKMTVRFDTDSKPISVGKVREFAPFLFMANDYDATEAFEIYDVATLRAFAASASANTFYPRTEAKLMANIDMTGEEWTPIEGFRFTFNGNNKSIIGLSAPLFGTTSGVIKNLKLENVALVSNGNLKMGSVACVLASTGYANKAAVINCEASGTLTVSNPDWVPTSSQDKDASIVNYGGLVGAALGADVTDSTNKVAITVDLMQKAGSKTAVYSSIAGVVGCADIATLTSGGEAVTIISGCKNEAPINYVDKTSAETKALVNGPRLGAILGCGIKGAEVLNCENSADGDITLNSYFYGAGAASGGIPIGGLIGYNANGVVKNSINRGDIEVDGTLKAISLGGVGGYLTYCWSDDLQNYGAMTIKESVRLRGCAVGGVAGMFYGNGANTDHTFGNCTNHGPIKVLASHEENHTVSKTTDSPYYYRIGGITGFGRTKTTGGCTNNGDITISGDIKIAANSEYKEEAFVVAGCVGFKTSGHPAGKWENNGDILVDATISFDDEAAAKYHPVAISGCFGPQPGNPDEGYNNGNITFNGKYEGTGTYVDIGGIYAGGQDANGYNNKTPIKAKNTGNITIGDDAVIGSALYVGGIIGTTLATTAPTSLVNEGDITISEKVTIGGKLYAGGAYGYFKGGNLKNVSNSGDINIYGNVNDRACVGGICVYGVTGKTATDVTNTGNIVASGTYKGGVYAGGVFSELAKGDTGNLTRVVNGALGTNGLPDPNKGKITISGFCDNDVSTSGQSALIIGGVCGGTNYDRRPGNMNDCHNYGTLEASGTFHGRIYFSGFSMACMSAGKTITNCSQEGDLIFSGKLPNKTNGALYFTGFAYTVDKAFTVTNFKNKGNITISETAEIAEVVYMMGYGYRNSAVTYDGCSFSGNLTHNGKQTANTVYMSALAGERFSAIIKNGYTNSGNVSFGGTYSGGGYLYISGLGTLYGTPTFGGTILNTGTISFTGKSTHADSKIRLGGLFASVPNTVTTLDGTAETVDFVNKSNIIATGESAGAVAVGGIAAIAAAPITAAKSYSNIEATNSAVVGWITSSERTDTVKAINCAVGGMRITGWDDSDSEPVPTGTKINSANFHNYIYGLVDWTNVENYDGCRLLPASEVKY
ncbi:MAG: hypothetical protein IIX40_04915 [Alistipes sp.]|nr:hypothetical protein [Alistipes sp.]